MSNTTSDRNQNVQFYKATKCSEATSNFLGTLHGNSFTMYGKYDYIVDSPEGIRTKTLSNLYGTRHFMFETKGWRETTTLGALVFVVVVVFKLP